MQQEQVQYLAYYDALTGLANRILLQDRISKALASARGRAEKVGLLFQQVAERLKKMARA